LRSGGSSALVKLVPRRLFAASALPLNMDAKRSPTATLLPPAFFLLAALIYIGCTTDLIPATGEKRYLGFTWEEEVKLGKQASQEVAATFGIYKDPKLERYVDQVGQRVLARSHLRRPETEQTFRNTPVTFEILDSPIINAMALPGGHIYVTRGMLAHLNSEDQLAVVLAHEIGHVAARHAARQTWQQQLGQGLLLGGAILGQTVLGLPAEQILNLGATAAQIIFLRYSREDELEADRLGVEYSSLAGYNAEEVTNFFRTLARIQEKEGQGLPNFLSTHPDPGDRIQRIKELTAKWRPQQRERPARLEDYYAAIDGIVLGEDPRQGFVERNVFYHPDLGFQFPVPPGFKVINQPTQVIMVENKNRAMLGFTVTGEKSLDAAASKFTQQGGLKVIESGRVRASALPAIAVVADGQMANSQVVRLLAYFVEYRGRIYHFVGYTSPEAFASFRSVFLQTMNGFGEVRDSRVLRRQPVRLQVQPADRAAPFRAFVPRELPPDMRPEDVAILNQVTLDQEIPRGTFLKLPKLA
jgi:predicted Zn-dependent protease